MIEIKRFSSCSLFPFPADIGWDDDDVYVENEEQEEANDWKYLQ